MILLQMEAKIASGPDHDTHAVVVLPEPFVGALGGMKTQEVPHVNRGWLLTASCQRTWSSCCWRTPVNTTADKQTYLTKTKHGDGFVT
jgi:hypothetical protein